MISGAGMNRAGGAASSFGWMSGGGGGGGRRARIRVAGMMGSSCGGRLPVAESSASSAACSRMTIAKVRARRAIGESKSVIVFDVSEPR